MTPKTKVPKAENGVRSELLKGNQTPRLLSCPPSVSSAGAECVELAASFGLILDDWQQTVLHHALGEQPDGRWAAFEVGLCVPRQNGKGSVLEALMLAAMFLFEAPLTVYSAHEFSTSLSMLRRLELLIRGADEYAHMIKAITHSNGKEGIELTNGCRAVFRTRTKSGGRGLAADITILDECMILGWDSYSALMPTLSARPNAQLWYVGSAVDQQVHVNGEVFTSVRRRGLEGTDPKLMWCEWSCTEEDDPADPLSWAAANPSLNIRIRQDHVASEFRAWRHSPRSFAVERLGVGDWPEMLADEHQPVIADELWDSLAVPADDTPALTDQRALAIDRSPDGAVWTVAAAVRRADSKIHVELGYHGGGDIHAVLDLVRLAVRRLEPDIIVIDTKSTAAPLAALLKEVEYDYLLTNTPDFILACGGLVADVEAGVVSHTDQIPLTTAVGAAGKRELPSGGWAWSRKTADGSPITALVGVTLAHFGLRSLPPPAPKHKPAIPLVDLDAGRDDGFKDWSRTPF